MVPAGPKRGRTRGGKHRVRGRRLDEPIHEAPPRIVAAREASSAAVSAANKAVHPGTRRLRAKQLRRLRERPLQDRRRPSRVGRVRSM